MLETGCDRKGSLESLRRVQMILMPIDKLTKLKQRVDGPQDPHKWLETCIYLIRGLVVAARRRGNSVLDCRRNLVPRIAPGIRPATRRRSP
jgi:hypothetical protein